MARDAAEASRRIKEGWEIQWSNQHEKLDHYCFYAILMEPPFKPILSNNMDKGAILMGFNKISKKYKHCTSSSFFSKNIIFYGRSERFWVKLKGNKYFLVFGLFEQFFLKKLKNQLITKTTFKKAENPKIFFPLQFHSKPSTCTKK